MLYNYNISIDWKDMFMNSLILNFIKRAVIVPVIVTALCVCGVRFIAPKLVESSNQVSAVTSESVDASIYNLVKYNNFNDLKKNDYVATVTCETVGMSCAAVFNCEDEPKAVDVDASSTEPWNDGTVVLVGENTASQFNKLHKANLGDEVVVEFYKHDKYTYKISKIEHSYSRENIQNSMKYKGLLLCCAYNDFSDLENSKLYTVYFAEKV